MKTKLLFLGLIALATATQAASLDTGIALHPELKPELQQSQVAYLAANVLAQFHYKAKPLDDALSKKIFDDYLKSLDPEKVLFVQQDIDQLVGVRTKLINAILNEDLSAPFGIFNLYVRRVSERFAYARTLLKDGFDFRQQESYQFERAKEPWPKSELEMRELWRKRVKNDWLRLKLAGTDEQKIFETLDKRYDTALKRIGRVKSGDAFQLFMNAYTMAMDPHTNYMGPRAAEEFDISMRLSLVGIGASLEQKNDYITVRDLVTGGPAALSGQLNIGDRIVGVTQGENGVMTDIVGMRPDEVVALIRGAADSTILLDVLPAGASPDSKHKLVSLVRKKIALEEQSAKKTIIAVAAGTATRHIGVISLPMFYEDFEGRQRMDADFKSATRDVARLLDELKREKVDGVLIDLRNNGGGSLSEAIELSGLFIGKGPVMQQRDARGAVMVGASTKADVAWSGPLGVLIDRGSASASEIFAAAIQDYGRGVVIGEPSFGKGTVQTVINLDQVAKNDKPQFGELKLTIAQFFRINGGTTQLKGVTPDIRFPSVSDAEDLGEASFDNALPWMQIEAVDYSPTGNLNYLDPILLARHEARVKNDKAFLCLQESLTEAELQRKKNLVSLNEAERRHDQIARDARMASCEPGTETGKSANTGFVSQKPRPANNRVLEDDGLQPDERNLATELANEKAGKNAKDVLLDESAQILSDEADLLASGSKFASIGKSGSRSIPDPDHTAAAFRTN